ncbi:MAG: choice-of-anchor D domain-containing protein, partial [Bacteroidetes bacterium]
MKKIIFLCSLFQFITLTLVGQTLSVFDIDTSSFPLMKAKFFAFDKDWKQIRNFNLSDFEITEDSIQRTVTRVSCPAPKPEVPVSSVITIDVSGSMKGEGLKLAQMGARTWVNTLNLGFSECAITSFSDESYFNQDFTTKRQNLLDKIASLNIFKSTNYDIAFLDQNTGAIQAAMKGMKKRVIIFLSDGQPNFEPQTNKIIQECKQNQISVFSIVLKILAPQCLKVISEQTGGMCFENVTTEERITEIYLSILHIVTNSEPCDLEWLSEKSCLDYRICSAVLKPLNVTSDFNYFISDYYSTRIEYYPSSSIRYDTITPPNTQIKNITITARNKDILINKITFTNPDFGIFNWDGTPPPFTLSENESRYLLIKFSPSKKGYAFCKFNIESDACSGNLFFARTNFIYDTSVNKTLKITYPNGGESFLAGTDTIVKWEGVLPCDTVSLEFSNDSGANWKNITKEASNFTYKWNRIPLPTSSKCLMKVKYQNMRGKATNDLIKAMGLFSPQCIVYSPDGSKLAVAHGYFISIIDMNSYNVIYTFTGHTNFVNSVAFSPDGTRLASCSSDKTIKLWDIISGTEIQTFPGQNSVSSIAFSPDGSMLASGHGDSTVKLWDINSGIEIRTFSGHTRSISSVAFCPDGLKLASGSYDKTIKLWDIDSGTEIRTLSGNTNFVTSIEFSPDGTTLASGCYDDTIKLWDINSGTVIKTFSGHFSFITSVTFSPDGTKLASGSSDARIKLWDINSGTEIKTFLGSNRTIRSVAFCPDGTKLASCSDDNTIKIWDINLDIEIKTITGHTYSVCSVAFSPDGSKIASGSDDNTIKLWDLNSGNAIKTLSGHNGGVSTVAYSPDGTKLASGSKDLTIKLWDMNSDTVLKTFYGREGVFYSVAFSPDGTKLASGDGEGEIILWDLNTGTKIYTFSGHNSYVSVVAFSPDGTKIASGSSDKTIKIWDVNSGTEIKTITGHNSYVSSIAYSPDGTMLASGSWDNKIKLWDINLGTEIRTYNGHTDDVYSVAFSPDGTKLASGGKDRTIKLWNINSGVVLKTYPGHFGDVSSVAFSPDGTKLASGSMYNFVFLWSVDEQSFNPVQEDKSDSLWSIIAPQTSSNDIDMKQALVGTVKDSVITGFITNTGSYPCRIDSIYFKGGDNTQFAQVSGFPPFTVDVGKTKSVEFRFKPNSVGNKSSTIVIITQADTLRQGIIGEGVLPQLQVMTNILDFGKVELGNEKTFQDTLLLKNISTSPIDITNTELMYPDKEQFYIISGGGGFTLNPGESRPLTVQFKPKYGGRTSGGIGFDYAGTGSPAIVSLYGEGIGGLVTIPDDSANPGETRELKLNFSKVKMEGIQAIASSFKSKVRFQRTILAPLDRKSISTFSKDSVVIDVEGDIGNNTELASIPVVAALGATTETTLDLLEFNLYDAGNNVVDYDIETRSGKFKILGICEEGGKRLLDFSGNIKLFSINPNPSSDDAEIEFELIESDRTHLIITNILGEKVLTLLDGTPELGRQKITFNTNELTQGNYFVIL